MEHLVVVCEEVNRGGSIQIGGEEETATIKWVRLSVVGGFKLHRRWHLKGNFGSHTLRKTFGYIHRTVFNTDIPTLMQMFNHSSQRQTLTYLGIQPSEIKEAYLREI